MTRSGFPARCSELTSIRRVISSHRDGVLIMKIHAAMASLLLVITPAAVAQPVQAPITGRDASIPFASLGGIEDWRANGDKGLWIRGRSHNWYYAELMGSCSGLGFEDRIGFVIEPYGSFDKFSSIVVEGRICHIKTLRESDPPPKKKKKLPRTPPRSP